MNSANKPNNNGQQNRQNGNPTKDEDEDLIWLIDQFYPKIDSPVISSIYYQANNNRKIAETKLKEFSDILDGKILKKEEIFELRKAGVGYGWSPLYWDYFFQQCVVVFDQIIKEESLREFALKAAEIWGMVKYAEITKKKFETKPLLEFTKKTVKNLMEIEETAELTSLFKMFPTEDKVTIGEIYILLGKNVDCTKCFFERVYTVPQEALDRYSQAIFNSETDFHTVREEHQHLFNLSNLFHAVSECLKQLESRQDAELFALLNSLASQALIPYKIASQKIRLREFESNLPDNNVFDLHGFRCDEINNLLYDIFDTVLRKMLKPGEDRVFKVCIITGQGNHSSGIGSTIFKECENWLKARNIHYNVHVGKIVFDVVMG